MALAVIAIALLLALLPLQTASAADPVFDPTTVTLTLTENTPADQDVGAAVTATDADTGDTLTYTLGGTDAASFTIVSTTGQIRTKPGVTYDHEAKSTYSLTVTATDTNSDSATATVTINVTDVDEPPSAPSAPTLAAGPGSTTSLQVSWTAPSNTGKPDISSYDLQYKQGASGDWTDGPQDQTGTSATISSLTANTRYEVQVRATNAEGDGPWSDSGPGATSSSATSPTVSDIAVTSSPGADGEYTTLDVITVGVTFSEAVTVTGEPQLPLDIGGRERLAEYSGLGTVTGQLLFSYTVQPVDQDDDGVGVNQSSLVLNEGTIAATDDSAQANPTHPAMAFAGHRVDTELVLIGNMEQTEGTALRINAGETYKLSFYFWDSIHIYELSQIVLDVKTASDTLNLAVTARIQDEGNTQVFTFSGSVATAGMQAFRTHEFTTRVESGLVLNGDVEVVLTATGSGYVELGTTSSTAEDEGKAYRWSIGDSFSKSNDGTTFTEQAGDLPRFNVVGHATEVLRILASEVVSEPADQMTYRAGEDIEVFVVTSVPATPIDNLTIPLQLGSVRRQAALVTVEGFFDGRLRYEVPSYARQYVLHFSYTVQPGDTATGVGIAADPLGSAGISHAMDSRIARDLSLPAQAPEAGSGVDGSRSEVCDAVHCAHVTDRKLVLRWKSRAFVVAPGGATTLTLVLEPASTETVVTRLSSRVATTNQWPEGAQYSGVPDSIAFVAGDTEKSFTFSVTSEAALDGNTVSVRARVAPFVSGGGSVRVQVTNAPESFDTSARPTLRGYDSPKHIHRLLWSAISNRVFHYDQRYVIKTLEVRNPEAGGDVELNFTTAPPLSEEARSRLGLVIDSMIFAFSDAFFQESFKPTPTTVEAGIEHLGWLDFTTPLGPSWEANQRYAIEIVEVPVTATFDAATYAAGEGDTVDVTVTLGGGFRGETVTLPITVSHNGGATTADYSDIPPSLVFAQGETEKSFTVTLIDDSGDDEGESITLGFGASEHITSGGTNETATISITDNDDSEAGFSRSAYTAAEGGTVSVTVQLSSAPTGGVTIPLAATGQGGATAEDYSGVPQSITFAAGETTKTFTFTATQDETIDHGESVLLGFGTLPAGIQAGPTSRATVRINDDDTKAGFGRSEYTVAEGGTVSVTVRLASALPRGITIPITATGVGGATVEDYSVVPQSIAFAAGETTKTFTFTATQDKSDDDGESVRLGLGLRPGIAADRHATATVAIRDDDTARVRVSTDTLTIPEGSSREYTVWLATVPDDTVVVTPRSSNPSVTFVPPTLTYTPEAWAVPQTVRAFAGGGGRVRGATLTHAVTGYGIVTEAPPVAVRIQLRPTPTPGPRPTATPTPAPVVLPPWIPAAPDPTATPTPVPTPTPTATPTAIPTPSPTPTPSATPVPPSPTPTPTASPTPSPTPTAVPTAVPVVSPPNDGGGLPWWLWPLLLLALLAVRWAYRRLRRRRRRQGERRWYG